MSGPLSTIVEILKQTGHAVPINDKIKKRRLKYGLSEIPPTIYTAKDDPNGELTKFAKNLFNLVPSNEIKEK